MSQGFPGFDHGHEQPAIVSHTVVTIQSCFTWYQLPGTRCLARKHEPERFAMLAAGGVGCVGSGDGPCLGMDQQRSRLVQKARARHRSESEARSMLAPNNLKVFGIGENLAEFE